MIKCIYGCFIHWKEAEILYDGAQSDFYFLHCKPHTNAITWAHSKRHVGVRVQICFIFRTPSIE